MDAAVFCRHCGGMVRSKRLMFLIAVGVLLWAVSLAWREVQKRLFGHGTLVDRVGHAGTGPI